jgi:hypothetical protein
MPAEARIFAMVPRERLELPTCGLGNRCSVLLSYRGGCAFAYAKACGAVNGAGVNLLLTISVHR